MITSRRTFLRQSGQAAAYGSILLLLPEKLLRAAWLNDAYLERAVHAMGTTVSVSAFGQNRVQLLEGTTAAFTELTRLERLLSVYDPASDISRLNTAAGRGEIRVHPDTWEVLSRAKTYHTVSGGSFDVTVEPLLERSGFRDEVPVDQLRGCSPIVGDAHLRVLKDAKVCIDQPGVKVDTGGIAVGYAVDRMIDVLRSFDVTTAVVNHGGDLYAMGAPEDSDGWEVVIPHPTEEGFDLKRFFLIDRALSTSTNSRNTRSHGGSAVGHIFDPRSGENPAACLSMSVVAQTSCEADALSTASFVSGDTETVRSLGCDYVLYGPGERLDMSFR